MKKQPNNDNVKFVGFYRRLFANTLDSIFLFIIAPIFLLISNIMLGGSDFRLIIQKAIKEADFHEKSVSKLISFLYNNDYVREFLFTQHGLLKFIILQILQITIISAIVLFFWYKKQATPAKMLLNIKIADEKTLGKPTKKQLTIRYLIAIFSILILFTGYLMILFTKKKQALHDKISGTIVIKA